MPFPNRYTYHANGALLDGIPTISGGPSFSGQLVALNTSGMLDPSMYIAGTSGGGSTISGGYVSSVNSATGALTIAAADSTIKVTTSGQLISLAVAVPTPGFVQHVQNGTNSLSGGAWSVNVVMPSVGRGNSLLVMVTSDGFLSGNALGLSAGSCTDNQGDTPSNLFLSGSGFPQINFWIIPNCNGGNTTVTVGSSSSNNTSYVNVSVTEWNNLLTASVVDVSNFLNNFHNDANTTQAFGPFTTTNANDLIVLGIYGNALTTIAPPAGFSTVVARTTGSGGSPNVLAYHAGVVSSVGTYNPVMTFSANSGNNYVGFAIALKAQTSPLVSSFNGRGGVVIPQTGDYTVSQVTGAASQVGVQDQSYTFATDTGTANAYAVTLSPVPTLVNGSRGQFKAANSNTGASTLAVNGGSPIPIKKNGNTTALSLGDITAGQIIDWQYDLAANVVQITVPGSGGGGTGSGVSSLNSLSGAISVVSLSPNLTVATSGQNIDINLLTTSAFPGLGAEITSASAQAIATATDTTATMATIVKDIGGFTGANANALTVPVGCSGWYMITATTRWATTTGTGIRVIWLKKNGSFTTGPIGTTISPIASADVSQQSSYVTYLNAGDQITVDVFQTSGGSLNINTTSLSMAYLGGQNSGLLNVQILQYTGASGIYVPTPGTNMIVVEAVGGGGGSGGAAASSSAQIAIGQAGGGGGFVKKFLTANFSGSSYFVGTGGGGGASGSNAGGNGGNTTFATPGSGVSLIAGGGGGGGGGGSFAAPIAVTPAAGGVATGGDINIPGAPATFGFGANTFSVAAGNGGASHLGQGALGNYIANASHVNGLAGQAYGSGASGGGSSNAGGAASGAAGANGLIIVWEYGSGNTTPAESLIAEVSPSGTTTVSFTNIPQNFKHLKIIGAGRSSKAGTGTDFIGLTFNSDTGANYAIQGIISNGNTGSPTNIQSTGQTATRGGELPSAGVVANYQGDFEINIPNYSGTTFAKSHKTMYSVLTNTTTASLFNIIFSGLWNNTVAISRIDLTITGNWVAGSVVSLYGKL